jgi:hypothetical protein
VSTALSESWLTLTDDQLQVAAARVGVQSLPIVLNVRPRHDDLATAVDTATGELAARGLIHDGAVAGDLADQLHVLQRPDRELAVRLVTPQGIVRMTVVRRGSVGMWARRIGNDVTLSGLNGSPGLGEATRALLEVLPPAPAAEIVAVGAPLDAMGPALNGTHDSAQLSDRIRSLGAEPRAALLLGTALASRQAFAEITYYTLDDDRVTRPPGAVGVFYTKRGRIVGAPSASPSGQLWTTLKGGSDHAVRQAVGQLVELSTGRWEEF